MRKIKKILVSSLLSVASMCTLPVVVNATIRSKKANNFIASNDSRKYVNFLNTETTIYDESAEKEKIIIEISKLLSKFYKDFAYDESLKDCGCMCVNNFKIAIDFHISQEIELKQAMEGYIKTLEDSLDLHNRLIKDENIKIAEYKHYLLVYKDENVIDIDSKNELESHGFAYTESLNAFNIDNKKRKYCNLIKSSEENIQDLMISKKEIEGKVNYIKDMLDKNKINEKINALQCAKEKIKAIKNFKNN